MKKLLACLTVTGALLLTSCVTTKTYTSEEKLMRQEDDVFVITNNGKKVSGDNISVPSIWNRKNSWVKIDGQKFDGNDINAYQDKKAYYAKYTDTKGMYGWVKQLKRGAINLFYYDEVSTETYFDGMKNIYKNTYTTHFLFQKGSEPLKQLSITDIAILLGSNKDAYAKFTNQFGSTDRTFLPKQLQNHPKVLFAAVDIYNR